jgi:hypothetical protein
VSQARVNAGRIAACLIVVVGLLVWSGLYAFADNSVSRHSNHQTINVDISRSGNTFTCHARNVVDPDISDAQFSSILVSVVCQYKAGGNWFDFERAPANSTTQRSVEESYTDNPCTASDGGANLANGPHSIRAQADGYWQGDVKFAFGRPVNTTKPFPVANC